ncbi:pyrimidine 5'-nucleotidase [Alkalicaulis satelles]|uniref:Pyrimidine 5'-nucleotidase n=1 Tax=Alkalicaulis satelles TaxID=2609175 RepID=A0A5M6ZLZ5_9PROT|nr:pyrimidine 5'-nucleotidase [Alkalicaulis satelles]KAA5804935.1 pyrimidine 5'-nucleotidase [Alkalicaulis satelles]
MSAPRQPALGPKDAWVFDLDNTLYPADTAVMSQVDQRMTEFVMRLLDVDRDTARSVQKRYWRDYGTTLNGLMSNHDVDLAEFLDFVHDVDHSVITPNAELAGHVAALEGKRIVFTNGSRKHAEKVIDRLGLNGLFDDLYDIEAGRFLPKPHLESFERFTRHFSITPRSAVMFEDSPANLETAAQMGFTTVLIRAQADDPDGHTAGPGVHPPHVHYAADCLTGFLGQLRLSSLKA